MIRYIVFAILLLCFSQINLIESPQICVSHHDITKQLECQKCHDDREHHKLVRCSHVKRDESKSTSTCTTEENKHSYIATLDYICNIPEKFTLCFVYEHGSQYQNNLKPVSCSDHHDYNLHCTYRDRSVNCSPDEKLRERSEFSGNELSFEASSIGVEMIHEHQINQKNCLNELIKNERCEFYDFCIESHFQCGTSGYPLNFGKKYCERTLEFKDSFPENGKEFVMKNLVCMKEALRDVITNANDYNCDKLREYAMSKHSQCFVDSGFCEIMDPKNSENVCGTIKGLWKIFQVKDLSDFLSLRVMSETVKLCREKGPEIKYMEMTNLLARCGYKSVVGDM